MNWKKLLKRFAVITGATILVLVATSVIILRYYEDEVIDYAIQRINENLRVKANVGEAHLVLWKTFPNASVELSNIMVEDSFGRHDTLFTADEIYLSFDLIQLFRGDYTIKKIAADDVDASLKRNKKGVPNWDVWKKTDSADSTKFELALEKIELNDAVVVYEDEKNQLFLDLLSTSTTAAGNFSADDIALQIEYEGEVTQLIRGESHFVSSLPMTLAAGIQIHTAQSSLEIQSCELNSDNLKLTATGTFDFSETPSYELAVSGKELDVAALLKHLPESVVHTLEAYRPGGTVGLTLNVSDRNKQKSTVTRADFTVENASLSRQATGVGINGVEAQGSLKIENGNTSIDIKQCKGQLESGWFELQGALSQKKDWSADVNLKAGLDLSDVHDFLAWDTLETCTGKLEADASIKGIVSENAPWLSQVNGRVEVRDGEARMVGSNKTFSKVNGKFTLHKGDATVNALSGEVNGNPFEINGELRNLSGYLTSPDQVLLVEADLKSRSIDMTTLLEQSSENARNDYRLSLPKKIVCKINTAIDKFTFGKFEATQISGLTTVNGQRADVNPLTFQTAGGQVNSQLALTLMSDGRFSVNSMSDLSNINISQLFYEFDNFGQKTITEKHLRGAANARVHFSTPLSDDLRIDTRAMESIIDIKITNGQLIGLESLQDVAVYLRNNKWVAPFVNEDAFAEKMKDIKFSSFENLVEIKNRKIHIPAMDIRSSAMDITVKGDHSFDQAIDYTIGFNLRDVLVRKERDITEADDGLGKQIFLFMRGTTVKPEFGLDHSASKEHRREELEAEKQNVKALLKEEFGWFKKDSLTTPYHDASKVTGTTVTVEWEESPKPAEVKPEKKEVPKPAETKKKVPKWLQENEEESSPSSISVDD